MPRTGWDDFASAQLSFPYLMALALKFRGIKFDYFDESVRARSRDGGAGAANFSISAPPEIDRLYPQLRPARVTVTTARGKFTRQADEALGSRLVPLDDDGLKGEIPATWSRPCTARRKAQQLGAAAGTSSSAPTCAPHGRGRAWRSRSH